MARVDVEDRRFDTPKGIRRSPSFRGSGDNDRFGRFTEWVARGMGTPGFLLGLSLFAIGWMVWNTFAPEQYRFDSIAIGFTALTLVLSPLLGTTLPSAVLGACWSVGVVSAARLSDPLEVVEPAMQLVFTAVALVAFAALLLRQPSFEHLGRQS